MNPLVTISVFLCCLSVATGQGFGKRSFGSSSRKSVKPVCLNYKSFRSEWLCPKSELGYDYDQAMRELEDPKFSNQLPIDKDTLDCVKDIPRPKAIVPDGIDTKIILRDICKMVKTPVETVWVGKEACVVFRTNKIQQDVYYATCKNPRKYTDNDMCQLDYTSRPEYRCVQSGFVEKNVVVHCRGQHLRQVRYTVPTTCSCRKCAHCEHKPQAIKLLLDSARRGRKNLFRV